MSIKFIDPDTGEVTTIVSGSRGKDYHIQLYWPDRPFGEDREVNSFEVGDVFVVHAINRAENYLLLKLKEK